MPIKIMPGLSPSGNPMIEFSGLPPETQVKLSALAQVLQMSLADGKVTLSEDILIGATLAALVLKS